MATQLSFGEYVRRLRKAKQLQLQEAAQLANLAVSHLSRIENDAALPNAETVVRIHRALGGDLEQMLALANCLPQEILDRLVRRVSSNTSVLPRSAGAAPDPDYARALIENIDPAIRSMLALRFQLSSQDIDGLFSALQSLAGLAPAEREAAIRSLGLSMQG